MTEFSCDDEVILLGYGNLQSRVIADVNHCLKIPHGLSFEQAATMPVAFATAIYSLIEVGSVKKGQV